MMNVLTDPGNEEEFEEHYDLIVNENEFQDVSEDLCIVSSGNLGIKTFENLDLSLESIYV